VHARTHAPSHSTEQSVALSRARHALRCQAAWAALFVDADAHRHAGDDDEDDGGGDDDDCGSGSGGASPGQEGDTAAAAATPSATDADADAAEQQERAYALREADLPRAMQGAAADPNAAADKAQQTGASTGGDPLDDDEDETMNEPTAPDAETEET
jgi:hypothetical protein